MLITRLICLPLEQQFRKLLRLAECWAKSSNLQTDLAKRLGTEQRLV